jgi:hypothetical protein
MLTLTWVILRFIDGHLQVFRQTDFLVIARFMALIIARVYSRRRMLLLVVNTESKKFSVKDA